MPILPVAEVEENGTNDVDADLVTIGRPKTRRRPQTQGNETFVVPGTETGDTITDATVPDALADSRADTRCLSGSGPGS